MKATFDQMSIVELAKQILDEKLKEGSYIINVYEIISGSRVFRYKYDSFLEFCAKVNKDCDLLDTYNDFYFEWETDD